MNRILKEHLKDWFFGVTIGSIIAGYAVILWLGIIYLIKVLFFKSLTQ